MPESLTMSFVSDSVGMVTRDKSKVSVQNAFIAVHLYRPMRRYIKKYRDFYSQISVSNSNKKIYLYIKQIIK